MTTDETVAVNVGACQCSGAPHEDGDEVQLRAKLDLRSGVYLQGLILQANGSEQSLADLTSSLAAAYLKVGVVAWNLVGENGGPIPVTPENIEQHLTSDFERSLPVADRADELYQSAVVGPLVKRAAALSSTSTTNGSSTSPTRRGPRKAPKRSRPSSTTTTQTGVTVTTSA